MTRINVIPASLLLDEHCHAAWREGSRPMNEIKSGKGNINKAPNSYKLGEGHVKFARKHLVWTIAQFEEARDEYLARGFNIASYSFDINEYDKVYQNNYSPSKKDFRHNLARICERFRKRTKPYHFHGKKVDSNKDFLVYLKGVKKVLDL